MAKTPFSGFFLGQYLRCYGGYEADICGRNLRLGTKYSGDISRSWLKGIILLSGESLLSFWRFEPMLGAAPCPQLDPCAQNFYGVIDYVIQSTKVESFAFLARLVLEI